MGESQIREIADVLWEYILKKHLKSYLSDSVCYYRAEVTTAPANNMIGVTRPYDDEVFVPYAGSASSLTVGAQCVVLVFGDPSNAIVLADGTLSTLGSGGGGGGGSYTPVTGKPAANQTPAFGGAVTISQISQDNTGQISATDRTITIPSTTATTGASGLMSSGDKTKLEGIATGAEVNQNAFSNVVVGATTIEADTKTDTLTIVAGNNIALTPDASTDTLTIASPIYTDSITTTTTWSGNDPYTQTVTVSSYTITSNSKVDIQPDSTAIAQLIADGVTGLYVSNTSGTLTMYAIGAAPTAALTLQVTITEVTAA